MNQAVTVALLVMTAATVAGCQSPALQALPLQPMAQAQGAKLKFTPVTIAEMEKSWNKGDNDGKLVTFSASFGKETFSPSYGVTQYGYKLWDHDGHGIRCQNIYSARLMSQPTDISREFNDAGKWLLKPGTYVTVEGAYHKATSTSSHGGVFQIPASIDVYFINGQPVRDLVAK